MTASGRFTYNLVVVGGGTGGLVAAAGAAGLGARVALIERHLMGGDCLNTGCVPSKTLISAARRRFTFDEAMARVRHVREAIAPHDSAERFRSLGVDVFFGQAQFADRESVVVGTERLRFARAVIATGARPVIPAIPGLAEAAPLTTENVFELTEAPRRMAIIGGGPVGCELAQAFQRLGIDVVLFHDQPRLLEREDASAAAIVQRQLQRDGVRVIVHSRIVRVRVRGSERSIAYDVEGKPGVAEVDAILVSAGRAPNVAGREHKDSRRGATWR